MDDSDDIEIFENFPVQNKSRSSLEDGRREKYCTPTENLEHFPDMYDYAPISNEVFNDDVQIIDNLKLDWSPTLQMHRVSNAAVDNEVFNDDVQIIDNIKLDFWAEPPAKKMRLMHFPGGSDGILTSFTCT
ncbi:hypothetical protein L195_g057310 [Trifolium pratense]|uniref:Uncharacterized protein n=2 Tax=Trifolium pratense TaxID=57577 RepID=A0A2K3KVQ6_TRIPR|nr:hypothetical protein L195_g057310 [Trifolium pratense]